MSQDDFDRENTAIQYVDKEAEDLFAQGLIYHEGIIQPKDNLEALHCFTRSACRGCVSALRMLIRYYSDGVVSEPDLREAYIWAVILKTLDPTSSDETYFTALESRLKCKDKISAQKEAKLRREQLRQTGTIALSEREALQEKPIQQLECISEQYEDDLEPSSDLPYKYLRQCKKHFNPELVEFELIVPHKLTKNEDMDFTQLKIRYNKKDTDTKDVSLFHRLRINKAERRLLLRLAAQNSEPDLDKRAANIFHILKDDKQKYRVSRINTMFEATFPGCSSAKKNKMICRQSGLIAVRLRVDVSQICKARDFDIR